MNKEPENPYESPQEDNPRTSPSEEEPKRAIPWFRFRVLFAAPIFCVGLFTLEMGVEFVNAVGRCDSNHLLPASVLKYTICFVPWLISAIVWFKAGVTLWKGFWYRAVEWTVFAVFVSFVVFCFSNFAVMSSIV